MRRRPSVSGYFYPGIETKLRETLGRMTDPSRARRKALAVVSPHAGYEFSGPVAGALFSSVTIPAICLVLGPAHRGIEPLFAVQKKGTWLTPLGEVRIDADLAGRILDECPLAEDDEKAHLQEHSLEVQVPFLQYFRKDVALVPVCVSHEAGYADLESLGLGMARAVRGCGREVLVVASTDMSHYVSQKTAESKDALAIKKILDLDARGLFETVAEEGISMCGYQPTAAALVLAAALGAEGAELIAYETSGRRTGDYAQVVGYAGIRIF